MKPRAGDECFLAPPLFFPYSLLFSDKIRFKTWFANEIKHKWAAIFFSFLSPSVSFFNFSFSWFTRHGARAEAHGEDVLEASGEHVPGAILDRDDVERTGVPLEEEKKENKKKQN